MENDQLSRRTRHARASLLIASIATILSLAHNIKFNEAQIFGITLNVTAEILFQTYTIAIIYFLYFFIYYCVSDYTNNSEKFFSYIEVSKKRYSEFFEDTFASFVRILIIENVAKSLEKEPSEEGPNSNTNILIGLEHQIDRCVSDCIRKFNSDDLWKDKSRIEHFTNEIWGSLSSKTDIANRMNQSDLDRIGSFMSSMIRNRKVDFAEISYPSFSKFHLRGPEIILPVILGLFALWINLGLPFSVLMIEVLKDVTSLLHTPICEVCEDAPPP